MARILWTSFGSPGEYFPIVPLVTLVRQRGHEVVVNSGPASEAAFTSLDLGLRFQPSRVRPRDRVIFEPDWCRELALERHADIANRLTEEDYDLVVVDCLALGAQLAAEAAGVPWVSLIHYGIDESSAMIDHRVRLSLHDRSHPHEYRLWWDECRATAGLGPDPRPEPESPWVTFSPRLTLVLGLPELTSHPGARLPAYVHRVGPTLWERPAPAPEWLERLDGGRSAVLLTNSTNHQDDLDVVVETARALAGRGIQIVATVAADYEVPNLGHDAVVAGFVPHGLVIPRVDAVVCSAGLGVTTKAVCSGVPVVAIPGYGDQYAVAASLEAAGAGIALTKADLSSSKLTEAVLELLDRPHHRARAHDLATAARRYDAPTTAADLLETVLPN